MRHHVFDAKVGGVRAQVAKFVLVNVCAALPLLIVGFMTVHSMFQAHGTAN